MRNDQKNYRAELIKLAEKRDGKYFSIEQFEGDIKRYIKAIKERRMICVIHSVSNSGMSRNLSFFATEKGKHGFWIGNFYSLFVKLGFSPAKSEGFKIGGCGMDMVFHTNYTIIHKLHRAGYITKKQCDVLAQNTPTCL